MDTGKAGRCVLAGILLTSATGGRLWAADAAAPTPGSDVNIEALYNLPVEKLVGLDYVVTSPDKMEEKIMDTAAAIPIPQDLLAKVTVQF